MATVFLCHATGDKQFLRKLADDLRRYSIEVWLDEEQIRVGDSLRESIEHGLDSADYVLVALSHRAVKSEWVRRELSAAFAIEAARGRKVILPVLLQKVSLPAFLRDKKYADFSVDYDIGLVELLKVLSDRPPQQQMGLETEGCAVRLDFIRRDGSSALYAKRHVQRSVVSGISSVVDGLLSDGAISHVNVSPGRIGRVWREMNTTLVETILPKPLNKGDKIVRTLTCRYEHSFTQPEEFWEQVQHHPSRNLEIVIRFLKSRPPKTSEAFEKRGPDRIPITNARLNITMEGKPALRLWVPSPRLLSSYVVKWTW